MLAGLTALAIITATGAAGPEPQAPSPDCMLRYDAAAERADRLAAIGDYPGAADAYRSAMRAACASVQRFLLYGPLAESECRAGNVELGRSLLADFKCMAAVATGDQECYASAEPPLPARGVTDACLQIMCKKDSYRLSAQPADVAQSQLVVLGQAAEAAFIACRGVE